MQVSRGALGSHVGDGEAGCRTCLVGQTGLVADSECSAATRLPHGREVNWALGRESGLIPPAPNWPLGRPSDASLRRERSLRRCGLGYLVDSYTLSYGKAHHLPVDDGAVGDGGEQLRRVAEGSALLLDRASHAIVGRGHRLRREEGEGAGGEEEWARGKAVG